MQFVYAPFYALFIVGPIANLIEIYLTRRANARLPKTSAAELAPSALTRS